MVVQVDLGFVGLVFRFAWLAFGLRFDPGFCGVVCGFVGLLMVGFVVLRIDVCWYDIVSCGLGDLGLVVLFGWYLYKLCAVGGWIALWRVWRWFAFRVITAAGC